LSCFPSVRFLARFPVTDILGRFIKGVVQILGTAFFYVRVATFKLSGLVGRGRYFGIGQ